jgi:hypothetical protein
MARLKSSKNSNSSANIGFEAKLWLAADKLRSNMDAAEYKHVVLGLIFLKYISDSFEEHHTKLCCGLDARLARSFRGKKPQKLWRRRKRIGPNGIGRGLRLLFTLESPASLYFHMIGNHDEVRRFLKSFL